MRANRSFVSNNQPSRKGPSSLSRVVGRAKGLETGCDSSLVYRLPDMPEAKETMPRKLRSQGMYEAYSALHLGSKVRPCHQR